ncbi:MAG: 2-succinyl-5-enolpyruvyl-6-hydroxy-3-cyclohexene-1-carboxylic-acid synthase [Muribaculaceae bacterium]|nr:2-succinyl-5-enolpyruvyl-6-hydroxy-3-cyclohexene-1-carboxylic-acid synthase [Muribaculaceae bacterium]
MVSVALARYGVRRVVVSPGSRNAPLIMALTRNTQLQVTEIIDERSAAFVALGMAVQNHEPVALVCTSGSAVLNYAPALAEACYRHVPLIAVTADRPEEWIDQDDGQTIRQPGALSAVVKGTYDLPLTRGDESLKRLCCRRVSDAMMMAKTEPLGPVHINVQIDEPLDSEQDDSGDVFRFPEYVQPERTLSYENLRGLTDEINASDRVLVVAGYMPPDEKLRENLERLPGNVAVIAELQSNLGHEIPCNIDAMLRMPGAEDLLPPDIVITIGGALMSRAIKAELRKAPASMRHWTISCDDHCVDSLLHLEKRIACTATDFFAAISPLLSENESDYASRWRHLSTCAREYSRSHCRESVW